MHHVKSWECNNKSDRPLTLQGPCLLVGAAQQGNSEVVEVTGEKQVQEGCTKERVCLSTSNGTSGKALRMSWKLGKGKNILGCESRVSKGTETCRVLLDMGQRWRALYAHLGTLAFIVHVVVSNYK